jgi:hypothetical protein
MQCNLFARSPVSMSFPSCAFSYVSPAAMLRPKRSLPRNELTNILEDRAAAAFAAEAPQLPRRGALERARRSGIPHVAGTLRERVRPPIGFSEPCLTFSRQAPSTGRWIRESKHGLRIPERDDFSTNRHPALPYWWSVIPACAGTGLFRKPVSTFRIMLHFCRALIPLKPAPVLAACGTRLTPRERGQGSRDGEIQSA